MERFQCLHISYDFNSNHHRATRKLAVIRDSQLVSGRNDCTLKVVTLSSDLSIDSMKA